MEFPRMTYKGIDLTAEPFATNSVAVYVSREMALDYGLVEPKPEEEARRVASAADFKEKCRAALAQYVLTLSGLGAVTEPAARAVLDLHAPNEDGSAVTCSHCADGGDMGDNVDWPCETVETIAQVYEIPLPDMTVYTGPRP